MTATIQASAPRRRRARQATATAALLTPILTPILAAVLAAPEANADASALSARLAAVGAHICGRPTGAGHAARAAETDRFAPEAAHPEAPWMAKLEIIETVRADGSSAVANCGGAALTRNWLLTAAHCVAPAPPAATEAEASQAASAPPAASPSWVAVDATLGASDLDDARAIRRAVTVAICPNAETGDDNDASEAAGRDLALLRVDPPLPPFFPTLRVASDPEIDQLAVGARALSAGWRRRPSGVSRELSAPMVRIAPRDGEPAEIIVAAPERNESSLCLGESGAPLVADLGFGPAVIGVFTSVDAIFDPETGRIEEICSGFEARSYFTSLAGLQQWLSDAIHACDDHLGACLSGESALGASARRTIAETAGGGPDAAGLIAPPTDSPAGPAPADPPIADPPIADQDG